MPEDESWKYFSNATLHSESSLDCLIERFKGIEIKPQNATSKSKTIAHANNNYGGNTYPITTLKKIYENGLFGSYTRYTIAFHLGRYFKYELNLESEKSVEKEITVWLKRHFETQCINNGLIPFEINARNLIKTPYAECKDETICNCLNGFNGGSRFKKDGCSINKLMAIYYIESLKLSKKKCNALLYLLRVALNYNSLSIIHSYSQLREGFNVSSRDTVSAWLKEFEQIGVFFCTKKGDYKTRHSNEYRLDLPIDCYEIIED